MEHAEQVRVAKRLMRHIASGETDMAEGLYHNPVSTYISESLAALEDDRFFRSRPLVVAASAELPAPHTFVTHDLSGQPLLITRDSEGQARVFLNVCRHRGARVAEGCGKASRFVCPYHAWTFGTDGRLRARPADAAFEGMDKAEHGLKELPAVERHGLIFAKTTPGQTFDLDEMLGDLGPELAAYGIDGFCHFRTVDTVWALNWKLSIDTFLESYHFNTLHRNSIHPIFHANTGAFDGFGEHLRVLYPRRTIETLQDLPETEWDLPRHAVSVYVLFPNTVLVRQGEHIELWQAFPAGVDKVQLRMTLLIPEPATTESATGHWNRNFELLMQAVGDEDFPVGEGVQESFHSGAQDAITFGRNEPALQHFHSVIRKSLDPALQEAAE